MTLKTGSPVLASAVVAFDCRTIEIKAVASHNVIFGAVQAVRLGPAGRRWSITTAPISRSEHRLALIFGIARAAAIFPYFSKH